MTTPIPQPPGWPFIGNVTDLDPKLPINSINGLADRYGEIFKLSTFGKERYFLCSERLVREVCDESRFHKLVDGALREVRNGAGSGLFTAFHKEHEWDVAHRVLVPAFGPIGIQSMWNEMYDIATQLVAKWARLDPDESIHATDDFTRLTLDSIALASMDTRFNSFYREKMHPFVDAMGEFLVESGARVRKSRLEALLYRAPGIQYQNNIDLMRSVAQEVIDRRRRHPSDKKDLLNAMLLGKDPKTGERLTDQSIMDNMITFLIAGHETTSGLLSFSTYYLIANPEALQRAQKEVDDVVGNGPVKLEHMSKLPYIEAVLRESLRLSPTAPGFTVTPNAGEGESVIIGGEYVVPPDAALICWLPRAQRDPTVYGPDADKFKPERMLGDNFNHHPAGAWKPFGNGARGCIGRPFAWQESILALALILQNFNLRFADPQYQCQLKQTLTVKPDNFYIKVALRPGIDPTTIEGRLFGGLTPRTVNKGKDAAGGNSAHGRKPMTILYGSNSGTCEGLAQKLASAAGSYGFSANVKSLDSIVDQFPSGHPVVLISASYEGQPPDNAAHFTEWLKAADESKFKGSQCAVFGCGHRDWVSTYQKIPTLFEKELSQKGARMILPRGETNVAAGVIFDDFDAWADKLWSSLGSQSTAQEKGLDLELISGSRASHLRYSVQNAQVIKNELLTPEGYQPEKRYVEFQLPTDATYESGDYLALLPINPLSVVSRVLRRFGLPWDTQMKIKKGSHSTIPTDVEISVSNVLATYVELNTAATKKNLQALASYAGDTSSQINTTGAAGQSVLDILEAVPELDIPFSVYLSMLPPMRIRQYSISSSPREVPNVASVTFSLADDGTGLHPGVATNYLKSLKPGSTVQVSIRKSPAPFHLPTDPSTPILMLCAGTGIAPFRGFVQDRAIKIASAASEGKSADLAPAVLMIGCRDPAVDAVHADELRKWESQGAVKIYYAYSRKPDESDGCKYVQDRMWREREEVLKLFREGAKAFICGSSAVGKGVNETACKIAFEDSERLGMNKTMEQIETWWNDLRGERYAVDVFD